MTGRFCDGCGVETRNPNSEHDNRPAYKARGLCARCYQYGWHHSEFAGLDPDTGQRPTKALTIPVEQMNTAWLDRAACRDHDPEVFYPTLGGNPEPALRVCHGCPVSDECLNYALATEWTSMRYGVWGGTTPLERGRLWRTRARA